MTYLMQSAYGPALEMLAALRANGQPFCSTFILGTSHEGRPIHGLRIHKGSGRARRAVLVTGGAHAREMIPPEAVLSFASAVCNSYVSGADFSFGGKTYPAGIATLLVEVLELIVVPMLNPDGRVWVETTDQSWRKNRRPGPGCFGVDINRNYDFLFSSGLGTSDQPCEYQIYRGPSANSEPEVQSVIKFINSTGNLRGVLDVHSFQGLILYPWGDDQNQSTNAAMSFLNSAFDGLRGIRNDNYKESILQEDWDWYKQTATTMRDRVHEVAQRNYIAEQSFDLYPTSGTLCDYPYSLHLQTVRPKILSMTVEIGFAADGGFRPMGAAADIVRNEGAVLITEFCLAIMCAGDAVLGWSAYSRRRVADQLREARDLLRETPAGRRYVQWSQTLASEVVAKFVLSGDRKETAEVLETLTRWWTSRGEPLPQSVVEGAIKLLQWLGKGGSKQLGEAIEAAITDLERLRGKPAAKAVQFIQARPPRRRQRVRSRTNRAK